jgi:1-acyl-sn-glycerol-3-phosphate acyltransferase
LVLTEVLMYYLSAAIVFTVKALSRLFFRTRAIWLTPMKDIKWEKVNLIVVLNHTSLFEPLFISALPNYIIWRAIKRLVVPVADITLNRPFVGRIFRLMAPNAVAITRKRDDSWVEFMNKIKDNALILIFPEGRMKRADGLDKFGKPMNVKAGIVDILEKLNSGKMVVAYSGGLHHVQKPGDWHLRLFQTIQIKFEQIDIAEYKVQMSGTEFRTNVVRDLETRMKKHCSLENN